MLNFKGNVVHNTTHNTFPCVLHAAGSIEQNPAWNYILKKIQKSPKQPKIPLNNELEIITYNTGHKSYRMWNYSPKTLGNAEMSMKKFAIPFTILGKNIRNWKNIFKLNLVLQFLQQSKKKYVLALDSSDVLVIQHPNNILDFFKMQNCKMLLNASIRPFVYMEGPIPQIWQQYEESLSNEQYRYLNSGVWIAEKEYAIEFYKQCANINMEQMIYSKQISHHALYSDQARFKCVFLDNPNTKLDYKCQVFQTLLDIPAPIKI